MHYHWHTHTQNSLHSLHYCTGQTELWIQSITAAADFHVTTAAIDDDVADFVSPCSRLRCSWSQEADCERVLFDFWVAVSFSSGLFLSESSSVWLSTQSAAAQLLLLPPNNDNITIILGCVWRDDDVRDSMNSLGFLFCFVFTTTTTSMTFSLYAQFSISPCTRCTRMLSPSLSFFLRLNVCCCLHLSSDNEWIGVLYPQSETTACDIQRPYVPCPSWVFGYFRKRLTTVWPGWISLYDCKLLYPVQHNCTQST